MYLSMLGWKVANIPLIPNIEPAPELFRVDQRRVVGLQIEPGELLRHRTHRRREIGLGAFNQTEYNDPAQVFDEVESIRKFMRRRGYPIIDTIHKPIETTAGEVTQTIRRKLDNQVKQAPVP